LYFTGFLTDDYNYSANTPNIPNQLTPSRDIEGTWVTTFAATFTIATDFQEFGTLSDVGTEERMMTWMIAATGEENIVRVDVSFTSSNRQLISESGYTPDVSPMQLTGIINGTQLILTKSNVGPIAQEGSIGVFTFTTHHMEGTWHDHWNGVYEQNVYTATNALKLMKQ
jgi:hypothetical protein